MGTHSSQGNLYSLFLSSLQPSTSPTPPLSTPSFQAFKNWANFYLGQRDLQITELSEDLRDGILLIHLVEIVTGSSLPLNYYSPLPTTLTNSTLSSGKSVARYNKNPRLKVQKINNINAALELLRQVSPGCVITTSAEGTLPFPCFPFPTELVFSLYSRDREGWNQTTNGIDMGACQRVSTQRR